MPSLDHRTAQFLIARMGNPLGYQGRMEYHIGNRRLDVVWTSNDNDQNSKYAFEIYGTGAAETPLVKLCDAYVSWEAIPVIVLLNSQSERRVDILLERSESLLPIKGQLKKLKLF